MLRHIVCGAVFGLLLCGAAPGDDFTYQGKLVDGGSPANGTYHLRFLLWDSSAAGSQIGSDLDAPTTDVVEGLFSVDLDFGPGSFPGAARWLEIKVITGGGATVTTLSPRQPILATPYAHHAFSAATAAAVPDGALPASYRAPVHLSNIGNQYDGNRMTLFNGGGTPRITMDGSSSTLASFVGGNVGIGTASPLAPLHVFGSGGSTAELESDNFFGAYMNIRSDTGRVEFGVNSSTHPSAPNAGILNTHGGDLRILTGGDAMWIDSTGEVGIGTTSPTQKLDVNGAVRAAGGVQFGDGSTQTTAFTGAGSPGTIVGTAFTAGLGTLPTGTTAQFLASPATITITATGQVVMVTSHKNMGSTLVGGAADLRLYIGYRPSGSVDPPILIGAGSWDYAVPQNSRQNFGLSARITGLAPGTYQVGLAGHPNGNTGWNVHEYSYTTAMVIQQ